jgi:hypothetical protein
MTKKEITLENGSMNESTESLKWGFGQKTLFILKSLWDRIAKSFDRISWEELQYIHDRIEENKRLY